MLRGGISCHKREKAPFFPFSTGKTLGGQGVIHIFHRVFHIGSQRGKVFYGNWSLRLFSLCKKNFFAKKGINPSSLYQFYGESQRNRAFVGWIAHFYLKFAAEYGTI